MTGLKYKTVYKEAVGELIEKKSKFYAAVKPIKSEEEALTFIEAIKKSHNNANHHVFAYVVGYNNEIQRYSDDGEPSGTAGLPILELLKGEDVKNTVIVVTRYFGGTLLGTGGLVRAYTHSAKQGLIEGGIIEKVKAKAYRIVADYNMTGKIQYYLNEHQVHIKETSYTHEVAYEVVIECEREDTVLNALKELTNGNLCIQDKGELYIAKVNNKIVLYEE